LQFDDRIKIFLKSLTLTGAMGNLITLDRTAGINRGLIWIKIFPFSPADISFVNFSNLKNFGRPVTTANSVNGGNNVRLK